MPTEYRVLEGENFTLNPSGAGTSLEDGSATNHMTKMMWSNSTAYQTFWIPTNKIITNLAVRTCGSQCSDGHGSSGLLTVYVDTVKLFEHWEHHTAYVDHNIGVNLTPGDYTLGVQFSHDYAVHGVCDRNLYLDRVVMTQEDQVSSRTCLRRNGSGPYVDRHPTNFDWRWDVKAKVDKYLSEFPHVYANTYWHHPPPPHAPRDRDSVDFWDCNGRGYAIDPATGDRLFDRIMRDNASPAVEWIIWRRKLYAAWNGWRGEPFGTDSFSWHDDHIHVTFRR